MNIRSRSQLADEHTVTMVILEAILELGAEDVLYQQVHGFHVALLQGELHGRFLHQDAAIVI